MDTVWKYSMQGAGKVESWQGMSDAKRQLRAASQFTACLVHVSLFFRHKGYGNMDAY